MPENPISTSATVDAPEATSERGSREEATAVSSDRSRDTRRRYGLRTLREIVDSEYPEMEPLVQRFLSPGETALLIARQKEGKSTLALQLAIDVSCGDQFLDQYQTQKASVLYLDYENRPYRVKERCLDIAPDGCLDSVIFMSYDRISDRNVGLFGEGFTLLQEMVTELSPGLLIIDPLRYAVDTDSSDERAAVNALDKVSELRNLNPTLAVILLHHLKKNQDNFTPVLRNDPRAWIERVYGSQALLAHVETIWGLEHDETGYALGTVSRSEDSFVLGLEKEESSQRFKVSPISVQLASLSLALRQAWDRLPSDFSWTEALRGGVQNSTLGRLLSQAVSTGLLIQDRATRRYRKVLDGGSAGEMGEERQDTSTG